MKHCWNKKSGENDRKKMGAIWNLNCKDKDDEILTSLSLLYLSIGIQTALFRVTHSLLSGVQGKIQGHSEEFSNTKHCLTTAAWIYSDFDYASPSELFGEQSWEINWTISSIILEVMDMVFSSMSSAICLLHPSPS